MSIFEFLFGCRIKALEQRILELEKKEQQDMSTTNDAFAKLSADVAAETAAVSALSTQLTTATTNINNALSDLKAQINSQPGAPDNNVFGEGRRGREECRFHAELRSNGCTFCRRIAV